MVIARPRYHADAAPTTYNRLHWCQAINHARDSIREIVVVTAHVNDVLLASLPNLASQARQLRTPFFTLALIREYSKDSFS